MDKKRPRYTDSLTNRHRLIERKKKPEIDVYIDIYVNTKIDMYELITYIYIYIYRERERYGQSDNYKKTRIIPTVDEGDSKAPFSIATTPRT